MRKYIPSFVRFILKEWRLRGVTLMNRLRGKNDLLAFRSNVYSQNGEDGVLNELCHRLGIHSGWIVEFGAWDGMAYSNTFRLLKQYAFQAVYIEADAKRYKDLLVTAKRYPIVPLRAYVEESGERSLDTLLASTPIPKEFEILSVDIDGSDYQVWRGMRTYVPKIVVIEINSKVIGPQIHGEGQGTSFESMLALGNQKGYTCVLHIGNMIFVRNDLVTQAMGSTPSHDEQASLFGRYKRARATANK